MSLIKANDKITAKQVRLVQADSTNVVQLQEALNKADQAGLDLVQINEAEIPVVKIIDLNKFLYEQKQADKENKKKQRQSTVQYKELQFSFETQNNDLNVKARNAQKFIADGKHVRLVLKMSKRRTPVIQEQCVHKMETFCTKIQDKVFVQDVSVVGHDVICIIKKQ